MNITLKAIRYNKTLSEETYCFSANLYADSHKIGSARNHGHGASTEVRIEARWHHIVKNNARRWLDILEPTPCDFTAEATIDDGSVSYPRIPADQRAERPALADLEDAVDILFDNWLLMRELKAIKSKAGFIKHGMETGQYIRFKVPASALTDQIIANTEKETGFKRWIHDLPDAELARVLDMRDVGSGPIVLSTG